MNFDGIPEETDAERAWRQSREATRPDPTPEAVEDPEPTEPPDLGPLIQQLVRWGGMTPEAAERALLKGLS